MYRRPRLLVMTRAAVAVLAALLVAALAWPESAARAPVALPRPVAQVSPPGPPDALAPRPRAARVYPLAARFAPGEEAAIAVEALSPTGAPLVAPVELTVFHLHQQVHHATSKPVTLLPDAATRVEFRWTPPSTDFTGYLAVVSAGGAVIGSTGVDVSSTPLGYPRYGYLSDFSPGRAKDVTDATVRRLAQDYHENMFQFYDWFWRHEKLIERENGNVRPEWKDLLGRTNSVQVIRDLIDATHRYDANAMAYVMVYAGREGYAERWPIEPSWGMFAKPNAKDQLSLDFTGLTPGALLFLFDPANPGWQAWMKSEYVDAIKTFGFDGVHIDQVGPRFGVFRADGSPLDLPGAFPSFLEAIDAGLSANDPRHAACTFNIVDGTVDGWAVSEVARSEACDFLYSEIWFKTNTYAELRRYIEQLRKVGRGRPVVLAAYPQYGEQIGPIFEAEGMTTLHDAGVASNEAGYTGVGFVDSFDNPGDSITWNVDLPESSTQSLVFRYANASGHDVTGSVYVNDRLVGDVRFSSRAEWSVWTADAFLQTDLEAGSNRVKLVVKEETEGAVLVDHLNLSQFDEDAVRLELAGIFASGATPIILGDNEQSLAHEYYPNRSKAVPPPLKRAIRDDFSFITAYETLLFPPEVVPLEGGTDRLVATTDHRLIAEGTDGIWVVPRRIGPYDTLHLVNLVNLDDRWRNAADTPPVQTDIGLRYYVGNDAIKAVYLASPDLDDGRTVSLPHKMGRDERGRYVEFRVPRLSYWDMVYLRRDGQ
ncbi:MAG: Carbohydrate binding family 6 [Acidimicrobiales bacterium]|nr:Carbohydrate binding family 6 [Acidimicrobiales bacterium]